MKCKHIVLDGSNPAFEKDLAKLLGGLPAQSLISDLSGPAFYEFDRLLKKHNLLNRDSTAIHAGKAKKRVHDDLRHLILTIELLCDDATIKKMLRDFGQDEKMIALVNACSKFVRNYNTITMLDNNKNGGS